MLNVYEAVAGLQGLGVGGEREGVTIYSMWVKLDLFSYFTVVTTIVSFCWFYATDL